MRLKAGCQARGKQFQKDLDSERDAVNSSMRKTTEQRRYGDHQRRTEALLKIQGGGAVQEGLPGQALEGGWAPAGSLLPLPTFPPD